MIKKLFFAALAAIAFTGCSEKEVELSEVQGGDEVQLTVRLPEVTTKATGTPKDATVNDVQIYIFDKNGVYETSDEGRGSSLTLTCTTGEKKIVALVNAPLQNNVRNIEDIRAREADLRDCALDNIVMAGEVTQVLTASTTVTMPVERLAARVSIGMIKPEFELNQHKNLGFKVKSVYLINAASKRAYLSTNTPASWYNQGRYIAETSPTFLYDDVSSDPIAQGDAYTTEHFFYCYPNATATPTRLVVEAEVGGYTYYYPITLTDIAPNTAYCYNLTITRLGSESPDVPVSDCEVKVSVTVKDWTIQNVNETI
jgi:hypothetical protein